MRNFRLKLALFLIFNVCICFYSRAEINSSSKTLFVVHIIPSSPSSYTVSSEINDIEIATRFAVNEFKRENPTCNFREEYTFRTGSETELFEKVKNISSLPGKTVGVGFSRSSLARLAAKAAAGSQMLGISIGAAAEDLKLHNSNFITMASPWRHQWKALSSEMKKANCERKNTLVIDDVRDSYSFNFRNAAISEGFDQTLDFASKEIRTQFDRQVEGKSCLFLAMNMSTSHQVLDKLMSSAFQGTVFGTGDWLYFAGELQELIKNRRSSARLKLLIPTGWDVAGTKASKVFSIKMKQKLGHLPEPNSAYSYDAIQIALNYLCKDLNPLKFSREGLSRIHLLRDYSSISSGGNYLSKIRLVTYDR